MKRCFLPLLSSTCAMWLACMASAQTDAQTDALDTTGQLRSHHILSVPQQPTPREVPVPPADTPLLSDSKEFVVRPTGSLLASVGTLSAQQARFHPQVWEFLDAREATALLSNITTVSLQPLSDRIAMLLQLADTTPRDADFAWFEQRIRALYRMGHSNEAASLLGTPPVAMLSDLSPLLRAQLLLGARQPQQACEAVAGSTQPEQLDTQMWDRLLVFCYAANANAAKVDLALALAQEQGTPYPMWFVELVESFHYDQSHKQLSADGLNGLDRAMVASVQMPAQPAPQEVPAFKQTLQDAPAAIAYFLRKAQPDAAQPWLDLLDRAHPDAATTYVGYELARFLRQSDTPRSPEAQQLPPFLGTDHASPTDKTLLRRFYAATNAFGYQTSAITEEWLATNDEQHVAAIDMTQLDGYARSANSAGYLLALAVVLRNHPLDKLPDDHLSRIVFDLRQLGESGLSRALASHAVLALFASP